MLLPWPFLSSKTQPSCQHLHLGMHFQSEDNAWTPSLLTKGHFSMGCCHRSWALLPWALGITLNSGTLTFSLKSSLFIVISIVNPTIDSYHHLCQDLVADDHGWQAHLDLDCEVHSCVDGGLARHQPLLSVLYVVLMGGYQSVTQLKCTLIPWSTAIANCSSSEGDRSSTSTSPPTLFCIYLKF